MRLTEISIRALKGSASYTTYFCDSLPGFGVRCGLKKKTYVCVRGKNRERITIGKVGDIPLADARKEAMRLLSSEPEEKTPSVRFAEARIRFLETYENPKTKYQVKRALERHFKPLETLQMGDIGYQDIEGCLEKLADRPSEQLHAFRYVRALFNWSAKAPRKWVQISPLAGYDPPSKDKKRARFLSDQELRAVWAASSRPVLSLFRLFILWGTRRGETVALEREWVSAGILTIPGSHTKNGKDLILPITPLAAEVLADCPANDQYYFPGLHGDGHLHPDALTKLVREVQTASGTKGWTPHDLRRTLRSNLSRLRVDRDTAEALINHTPGALQEIYDRWDRMDAKREALLKHDQFVLQLLSSRDATGRHDAPAMELRDETTVVQTAQGQGALQSSSHRPS